MGSGALGNNPKEVKEFLVGSFILFHCLVERILFRPSDYFLDLEDSQEDNLFAIAGYIYFLFIDPNINKLEVIQGNTKAITRIERNIVSHNRDYPTMCRLSCVNKRG